MNSNPAGVWPAPPPEALLHPYFVLLPCARHPEGTHSTARCPEPFGEPCSHCGLGSHSWRTCLRLTAAALLSPDEALCQFTTSCLRCFQPWESTAAAAACGCSGPCAEWDSGPHTCTAHVKEYANQSTYRTHVVREHLRDLACNHLDCQRCWSLFPATPLGRLLLHRHHLARHPTTGCSVLCSGLPKPEDGHQLRAIPGQGTIDHLAARLSTWLEDHSGG